MEKKIKQTKEGECELILTPKSTILAYYIDEARCCNWNEHKYVCRYIHVGDIETHIHHTNWSVVNGQSNWTTENKHIHSLICNLHIKKTMTQHNTHETGAARQSSGKKTSLKTEIINSHSILGGAFLVLPTTFTLAKLSLNEWYNARNGFRCLQFWLSHGVISKVSKAATLLLFLAKITISIDDRFESNRIVIDYVNVFQSIQLSFVMHLQ